MFLCLHSSGMNHCLVEYRCLYHMHYLCGLRCLICKNNFFGVGGGVHSRDTDFKHMRHICRESNNCRYGRRHGKYHRGECSHFIIPRMLRTK